MPVVLTDIYESRLVLTDVEKYVSGMRRSAGAVGDLEHRLDKLNSISLATGAAAGAIGIGLGRAVSSAAKMQQTEIGFKTMLGGAEAARAKIAELQDFAAKTPFSFSEVAGGAQTLLGMGAAADQVIPIMRALGNAVSASGKGQAEFGRATLAVSQIISKGRLQGDELLQLAEAGVPLQEMLKELGVSYGDVGKAGITAEQATAALMKVMNSGRFAGAMDEQSKTLTGSWSNLTDAGERLAQAVGAPLIGPLTTVTGVLGKAAQIVADAPEPVKVLAAGLGVTLAGGLGIASIATKILAADTTRLIIQQRILEAQAKKTGASVAASAVGSAATSGAAGAAATGGKFLGPAAWAASIGRKMGPAPAIAEGAATTAVASTAARTGIRAGLAVGLRAAAKFAGPVAIAAGVAELGYLGYQWWNSDSSKPGSAKGKAAIAGGAGAGGGESDELRALREQVAILKAMHGFQIKAVSGPASARQVLDGASVYRALGRAVA